MAFFLLFLVPLVGGTTLVVDSTQRDHNHQMALKAAILISQSNGGDPPLILDAKGGEEILINPPSPVLVSLLGPERNWELVKHREGHDPTTNLTLICPRGILQTRWPHTTIISLTPKPIAAAAALLHRAEKTGTFTLLPLLPSSSHQFLLKAFEQIRGPVRLLPPVTSLPQEVENGTGLLVLGHLSPDLVANFKGPFFLPHLVEEEGSALTGNLGIYSTMFLGDSDAAGPERRRILRKLNHVIGGGPRVVAGGLAYDAGLVAIAMKRNQELDGLRGASGSLTFDTEGYRDGGMFIGVSPGPEGSLALLQTSPFILQDVTWVGGNGSVVDHDLATSSILPRADILMMKEQISGKVKCSPGKERLEVLAFDPFTEVSKSFVFGERDLPPVVVIPNQHGFGLSFSCGTDLVMRVACTAGTRPSHPVSCYKSRPRLKREAAYNYNDYNFVSRADETTKAPPPPPPAPPAPAPSKLPELRQVLKAAKPFVGSCLGATTGCAVCVLVLGRIPIGAVPAACTGPCFVGTFGSCGSLLGRVFSETTVICTELFAQGHLDVDTFLADAEFGRRLSGTYTLAGYNLLATPLVSTMRVSEGVTRVVSAAAVPWARHMKFAMGAAEEDDWVGRTVHLGGAGLCFLVGFVTETVAVVGDLCGSWVNLVGLLSLVGYLGRKR